jgi:hypothetical protein
MPPSRHKFEITIKNCHGQLRSHKQKTRGDIWIVSSVRRSFAAAAQLINSNDAEMMIKVHDNHGNLVYSTGKIPLGEERKQHE